MSEKVFFILNKFSGKGIPSHVEQQIADACKSAGLELTLAFTQYKGHATELALEALASGYTRIFVLGGDGTVNEAAKALVNTPAALGIIPTGSGNGLARHLNIPLDPKDALPLLIRGKTMAMDTLRINGGLSVNVSGFGFDGHVASLFGKDGTRGLLGYAKLVIGGFLSYKEFDVYAVTDGQVSSHRAFMVSLANASQYGNNALVAPDASISDGMMDICFIRRIPLVEAVPFLTKMFRGKIGQSRFVTLIKAKHFRAELSTVQPIHLDGEPGEPSNVFEVAIHPASLHVIVPG
ncbi:MAG: diacylglycerol kinase family lipid kinase [Cyclobacteriaceae bacterium]|nr:diacylglycerol kinase family lipid kinase [Cyclobacteriaceae bacterium]